MAYNFNEIKLEKGMYSERGRSFEQTLEALDPNENYKGTPYEGLDAFQRQLKRFDIKVRGAGSDVVEKFFSTSESAVLFPEYVSRSVKAGMEEGNILPSITATVTRFDGMDYRSIYSAASEDDKSLRYVGEGAAIPQTEVRASDHLVSLKKRGRMLVASYEAIRFQRLDLFSVMLRQIGNQIMRMHLEDAIDVIKNGDGNSNAATAYEVGDDTIGGTKGSLSYGELLNFWNCFERHSEYPVLGFGDCVPSAILTFDRSYEIVLERAASIGDGVRLESAEPFELQIGARLYGGCRCTELKKTKKPDGSEVQRIKIAALCCEEVSGDE